MKVLSREDILDILYGGAILGTGGGGSLTKGLACIDLAISKGKTFTLASFDELDADDIIVCPYSCGAISPLSEEERKNTKACLYRRILIILRRLKHGRVSRQAG